jgi:hypothetical protein
VIAIAAANALSEIWPDIERDTVLVQSLRTNTTELDRRCASHLWHPDGHTVLFQLGRSLGQAGLVTSAVSHFSHLYTTATDRLGADHPDTLLTRSNLASLRGEAGDVAEFEQLLAEQVRVLGADHPNTLTIRNDLKQWRSETNP